MSDFVKHTKRRWAIGLAVILVIGAGLIFYVNPWGDHSDEPVAMSTSDTTSMPPQMSSNDCPVGMIYVLEYMAEPGADQCLTPLAYILREDASWVVYRDQVIHSNAQIQGAINDMRAKFNATTTPYDKLAGLVASYCSAPQDVKGPVGIELVPAEQRPSDRIVLHKRIVNYVPSSRVATLTYRYLSPTHFRRRYRIRLVM
jgi:hypothetical protein